MEMLISMLMLILGDKTKGSGLHCSCPDGRAIYNNRSQCCGVVAWRIHYSPFLSFYFPESPWISVMTMPSFVYLGGFLDYSIYF